MHVSDVTVALIFITTITPLNMRLPEIKLQHSVRFDQNVTRAVPCIL